MEPEKVNFLKDRLFYIGTGKTLFDELDRKLAGPEKEFNLLYPTHFDNHPFTADFHLKKTDDGQAAFLNNYVATLQKAGMEPRSQTFFLDHGKGITMKEAYNLLDGRSVNKDLKNKEGVVKNAWVRLDLKGPKTEKGNYEQETFYQSYGYNLKAELSKLPLPEMHAEKFKQLVDSLERGNREQVRLPGGIPGEITIINIQASPKFKTLDIFDDLGYPFNKVDKNFLFAIGERRNKSRDEALSTAVDFKPDPKILFIDPTTIPSPKIGELKSENIKEPEADISVAHNLQKPETALQNPEVEKVVGQTIQHSDNSVQKPEAEKTVAQSVQKSENAVQQPEAEKKIAVPTQKTAQAAPAKSKKENLAQLLPRKNNGQKKGLAI